jgi:hypothetical protein
MVVLSPNVVVMEPRRQTVYYNVTLRGFRTSFVAEEKQ